ncbi:hypothetical protein ACA910_008308 [Epithemia clementina (nom. ined.)]
MVAKQTTGRDGQSRETDRRKRRSAAIRSYWPGITLALVLLFLLVCYNYRILRRTEWAPNESFLLLLPQQQPPPPPPTGKIQDLSTATHARAYLGDHSSSSHHDTSGSETQQVTKEPEFCHYLNDDHVRKTQQRIQFPHGTLDVYFMGQHTLGFVLTFHDSSRFLTVEEARAELDAHQWFPLLRSIIRNNRRRNNPSSSFWALAHDSISSFVTTSTTTMKPRDNHFAPSISNLLGCAASSSSSSSSSSLFKNNANTTTASSPSGENHNPTSTKDDDNPPPLDGTAVVVVQNFVCPNLWHALNVQIGTLQLLRVANLTNNPQQEVDYLIFNDTILVPPRRERQTQVKRLYGLLFSLFVAVPKEGSSSHKRNTREHRKRLQALLRRNDRADNTTTTTTTKGGPCFKRLVWIESDYYRPGTLWELKYLDTTKQCQPKGSFYQSIQSYQLDYLRTLGIIPPAATSTRTTTTTTTPLETSENSLPGEGDAVTASYNRSVDKNDNQTGATTTRTTGLSATTTKVQLCYMSREKRYPVRHFWPYLAQRLDQSLQKWVTANSHWVSLDRMVFDASTPPMWEQVQRTSKCHVLFGPHGAGLTHAWFVPPAADTSTSISTTTQQQEPHSTMNQLQSNHGTSNELATLGSRDDQIETMPNLTKISSSSTTTTATRSACGDGVVLQVIEIGHIPFWGCKTTYAQISDWLGHNFTCFNHVAGSHVLSIPIVGTYVYMNVPLFLQVLEDASRIVWRQLLVEAAS